MMEEERNRTVCAIPFRLVIVKTLKGWIDMDNFRKNNGLRRRVLVIDDELINREILGNILNQDYEVSYAADGQEAMDLLHSGENVYSLVLLDLLMPVMDGFQVLNNMKADDTLKTVPVIVMTSEVDAEVSSIRLGAADFITKPYNMPEVILARCQRIIELSEDKSIISSAEKDILTGLYNRSFFFEYVRQIEKYDAVHSADVLVLNIDHFHMFNEMHGRKEGDRILRKLAAVMQKKLGETEGIGCRIGADTFYWYGNHMEGYEDVLASIQEELSGKDQSKRVRVRAGVYQNVDRSAEVENWFDWAKQACDQVRGDYSRQLAYYSSDLHDKSLYHEQLINDIDEAIRNKDLIVYYQPKYGIQGEVPHLRSAEALVRWKHPERGMISPGDFIPLFESNGLIQRLDHYVWQEAAAQVRKWKEEFDVSIPVSVNVSRIDIHDPCLEEQLRSILEKNGLSAEEVMLEITESAYAENARGLTEVVERLREQGFRIEMDDFGSGYSSLNMLTTISIDVLKMDLQFIRNMQKDDKSLKMVELVLDIAKFLKVPVVAEGVEDEVQLQLLKERGCDLIQGYYFSRPVPPEEFEKFIKDEIELSEE